MTLKKFVNRLATIVVGLFCFLAVSFGQNDITAAEYRIWQQMSIGKQGSSPITHKSVWLEIGKDNTTRGFGLPRTDTSIINSNNGVSVLGNLIYQINGGKMYLRRSTTGNINNGFWDEVMTASTSGDLRQVLFNPMLGIMTFKRGSSRPDLLIEIGTQDDYQRVNYENNQWLIFGKNNGQKDSVQIIGGNPYLPGWGLSLASLEFRVDTSAYMVATKTDLNSYTPITRNLTVNGTTQNLSTDRTFTITTSGTSDRITVTNGSTNPTIDIASTYAGQTSITTLGTVVTGVWNGSAISNAYLANSTISGVALGSNLFSLTAGAGLNSTTYNGSSAVTFSIATAGVTNSMLQNAAITIGTTSIALGASNTTIGGLSSVTSTNFFGTLNGTATNVTVNSTSSGTYNLLFHGGSNLVYEKSGFNVNVATNTITGNVTGTAGSETLATVTGRGATTSTAVTFNGGLTSTTGTFSSKLSWGTGTYAAGVSSLYNTADDGTVMVTKTGTSRDFLMTNGVGASVFSIPTGTNNVSFLGRIFTVDNIGVGTSSVSGSYRLTLNGDAATNTGGIVIRQNGTDVFYIGNITATNTVDFELWNPRNGLLRFGTNNLIRYTIDASGNHNFGTGAATFGGIATFNSNPLIQTSGGTAQLRITNGVGTGLDIQKDGSAAYFWNRDNTPIYIATNNIARLTILETGNVGIGTTTPEGTFHISQAVSSSLGAQLILDNPAASAVGNQVEISFLTDAGASAGSGGTRNARLLAINENAGDGRARFEFHTWNGSSSAARLTIFSSGDATFSNSSTLFNSLTDQTITVRNANRYSILDLNYGNTTSGTQLTYDAALAIMYYDNYYQTTDVGNPYGDHIFRSKFAGSSTLTQSLRLRGWDGTAIFKFAPQTSYLASYSHIIYGGGGIMYRDAYDSYYTSNLQWNSSGNLIAKYTTAEGTGYIALQGGLFDWYSYGASVTSGMSYTPTLKFRIQKDGIINYPAVASGGNRIMGTNNNGELIAFTIGSGLSLSGSTLSATGGSSGTVTGSGTSGLIPIWNSSSDIGNSIMGQTGTTIYSTGTDGTTLLELRGSGGNGRFNFNYNTTTALNEINSLNGIELRLGGVTGQTVGLRVTSTGYVSVRNTGVPLTVNSTNSNANKIVFQDNGTDRGLIGATLNYALYVSNSAGADLMYINSSTYATTFTGSVTATSFSGSGTGLSGTASSLTAGAIVGQANSATITASTSHSTANTIAQRDASGYINLGYINYSPGVESGTVSSIVTKHGDNYLRMSNASQIQTFLGLGSAAYLNAAATNTALAVVQRDASGNFNAGTVTLSGNLSVGTVYATGDVIAYYTSDRRLKNNIRPITNALEKVSKLSGNEYDWDETKQDVYKGHDYGVIAQEIESVLPGATQVKANGYIGIKNQNQIIALLIQAIKELKDEVQKLKK